MAANMAAPILRIKGLAKSYSGTRVLGSVDLDVPRGAIVALLGRSGSGKTTLLQLIGGLQEPDAGSLCIDGLDMQGVAAFDRPVNMMFQSYALFPHMSVADNIAYGLKARGTPRVERQQLVDWALDLVRLDGLARRRPDQLSGGQRQRVALARCLVMKPAVLLLDEPLAALDRGLRADVQRELIGIQRKVGTTFIIVTHDQEEAMGLSDFIAVMEQGDIVQFGTPREVYERPCSAFVAGFLGSINFFDGQLAQAAPDRCQLRCDGGALLELGHASPGVAGVRARVGVRPERVLIARVPTGLDNDFPGVLDSLSYVGNLSHAVVHLSGDRTLQATLMNLDGPTADSLRPGETVHAGFAADATVVLPA
jgi:putrescine transport system ATP-binding protein